MFVFKELKSIWGIDTFLDNAREGKKRLKEGH